MKTFNSEFDAKVLSNSVWNLFAALEQSFGHEKAWQFVLEFYRGAGSE